MAQPTEQRPVVATVSDPQKMGDGLQAYTSYKVSAAFLTPPPGAADATSYTVIRRFSDFVWLRGALRDTVPWALVPALPEKQQLGRFNSDFVDIRLRALQRFMDAITSSPELCASDALKKFVTLPYDALAAVRDGSRGEMVRSVVADSRSRVMKLVKTATTTLTTTIAEVRGGGGLASVTAGGGFTKGSSADDAAFASIESYLLGQAGPLTAVYNAAAALAIRYREQAQLLLDHGAALRSLGSTEGGAFGGSLSSVGLSTWAASTAAYEQAVQETELFVERLADHVRGLRATKELLEERSRASVALSSALADADRLRALVTALSSNPNPSALAQRATAEAELTAASSAAAEARVYYDKVASGVVGEVARYQATLRVEFQQLVTEFVAIQHRAQAKLSRGWERIGPDLAAAVTTETGGPYVPTVPAAAPAARGEIATASPAVAAALNFGSGPLSLASSSAAPSAPAQEVAAMFSSALSSDDHASVDAATAAGDNAFAPTSGGFADVAYGQL